MDWTSFVVGVVGFCLGGFVGVTSVVTAAVFHHALTTEEEAN